MPPVGRIEIGEINSNRVFPVIAPLESGTGIFGTGINLPYGF